MCGIAGMFSLKAPLEDPTGLLVRMTRALIHRGPDEEGFHSDKSVALGIRRLAIVDISQGHQPIFNEDRSVVMVCNGEIYNYQCLRRDLIARGHTFRSRVDVEVIVHLYEEYGGAFVDKLQGQFAIALYDARQGALLLVRDPAGIAPLFYTLLDNKFLFASEIKSLFECPEVSRKIDLTGVDQVLTFPGLISPRTVFRDVQSLAPGHILRITRDSMECRCYWDLEYPKVSDIDPAEPDWDDLADRLQKAVSGRLQADVPVGFYLSGGLDSSLIAAMIDCSDRGHDSSRQAGALRKSFSITFDDPRIDERASQELMASTLNARRYSANFGPDSMHLRLRHAVRCAEAPLKESYNTCSLLLSELVNAHGIKVVLTGEGADELFGGYVGYRLDSRRIECDGVEAEQDRQIRQRLWGDETFFYEKNYAAFREVKTALYAPALVDRLTEIECTNHHLVDTEKLRGRHAFHQRSYLDFKLRLADHLLADHGDRVAYAHSVEARYPYLDHRVIDWVRCTAPAWIARDGTEKYPLRRIAEPLIPAAVLHRQKFAFVAPSSAVLLRSGVDWVEDFLSDARIRAGGYFNAETIARLKKSYLRPGFSLNTTFDTDLLMFVLSFEILRGDI